MHPNIVILAGGASSRMKDPTLSNARIEPHLVQQARARTKSMIGLGPSSRPFLDYLLDNVAQAGYKDVVIVVGEHDDSVRAHYEVFDGAAQWPALTISFAVQRLHPGCTTPAGAADALLQALHATPAWAGKKFTVCNSDNLYSVHALRLLLDDRHDNAMIDYDRSSLQFDQERITRFAVLFKGSDGFLTDIIEKPSPEDIARAADALGRIGVSMNLFRLDYGMMLPVLDLMQPDPVRNEKDLPAAIKGLLGHRRSVFAIPQAEHVPDLTHQSDIPVVQEYLQRAFPSPG